jgi:regulator of telomere elongation helicase 1
MKLLADAAAPRTKAIFEALRASKKGSIVHDEIADSPQPPKIVYASRTHSQLKQVISELRNTAYSPRVCVLGSRDQLCINSQVKALPTNTARSTVCHQKVSHKACQYHTQVASAASKSDFMNKIMDIEEITAYAMQHRACPYYLSRENFSTADIVFIPYNYLIDPKMRRSQGIDLRNCVVIVDEAHNLESSCGDVTSMDFVVSDLSGANRELDVLKSYPMAQGDGLQFDDESVNLLKLALTKMEKLINGIILGADSRLVQDGEFVFSILEAAGINDNNVAHFMTLLDDGIKVFYSGAVPSLGYKCHLSCVLGLLDTIFKGGYDAHSRAKFCDPKYFKIHIHDEVYSTNGIQMKKRILGYWCFSPGVVMKELAQCGTRSLILASGTLSPMPSLIEELAM